MQGNLSEQIYQWQDESGAHGVGRLPQFPGDEINPTLYVSELDGCVGECYFKGEFPERILVRHIQTGDLEFVEYGKLSPYPSSPIPQP